MEAPHPVVELLAVLDRRMPRLSSAPDLLPRQLAAGCLARCRAVLLAMVAVEKAGRGDVSGLLIRNLWENWIVGLWLILEPDVAATAVGGAYVRSRKLLLDRWPFDEADLPYIDDDLAPGNPLNFEVITKTVERELRNRDHKAITRATSTYDVLYRFESTWGAHAGFGQAARYLADRLGATPPRLDVVLDPSPGRPEVNALLMAGTYTAHLAAFVFDTFGIGSEELTVIWPRLIARAEPADAPAQDS